MDVLGNDDTQHFEELRWTFRQFRWRVFHHILNTTVPCSPHCYLNLFVHIFMITSCEPRSSKVSQQHVSAAWQRLYLYANFAPHPPRTSTPPVPVNEHVEILHDQPYSTFSCSLDQLRFASCVRTNQHPPIFRRPSSISSSVILFQSPFAFTRSLKTVRKQDAA